MPCPPQRLHCLKLDNRGCISERRIGQGKRNRPGRKTEYIRKGRSRKCHILGSLFEDKMLTWGICSIKAPLCLISIKNLRRNYFIALFSHHQGVIRQVVIVNKLLVSEDVFAPWGQHRQHSVDGFACHIVNGLTLWIDPSRPYSQSQPNAFSSALIRLHSAYGHPS